MKCHQMRGLWAACLVVAASAIVVQTAAAGTVRDDFDAPYDYSAGTVPEGGIWTGSLNADADVIAFASNIAGQGNLTMGMDGVGWEGNGRDDAPYLYAEVPGKDFQSVTVKIASQTVGNWSMAGIMVRVPMELDDDATNDNLLTAGNFWTGSPEAPGYGTVAQNVVAGVETEIGGAGGVDLTYLRLTQVAPGEFEFHTSADGVNWGVPKISATNSSIGSLGAAPLQVGLWAGAFDAPGADGVPSVAAVAFDWVEIASVPEPASVALLLSGAAALLVLRRRRRQLG